MPATSKGYSAHDDAETSSRTLAHREEEAVAHLLAKTDQILSIVVPALVIWVGLIVLSP